MLSSRHATKLTPVLVVLLALAAGSTATAATPLPPDATRILSGTATLDASLDAPVNHSYGGSSGISQDGRHVAFASSADGLSSEDDNDFYNVFVKDRTTGAVTLVSRASGAAGAPADQACFDATISDDGNRVAFTCDGSLDPADTNSTTDVYVRDLAAQTTILVSRASALGAAGNGSSDSPALSQDGTYVAFSSTASNLDAADADHGGDVFRRRIGAGDATVLISRGATAANKPSADPTISDDGDRVAFVTEATNLDPGNDPNAIADAYVRSVAAGTVKVVSAINGSLQAAGGVGDAAISGDGAFVAFTSSSASIGDGDIDSIRDAHRRTLATQSTVLVSQSSLSVKANAAVMGVSIDDSGDVIGFRTRATSLPDADPQGGGEGYVRHVTDAKLELVTRDDGDNGAPSTQDAGVAAISGDGSKVLFSQEGGGLTADSDPSYGDTFVRDLTATPRRTTLVARPAGNAPFVNAGGESELSGNQAISADGRYAVFVTQAPGLGAVGGITQAVVRDLQTGAVTVASRADGSAGAPSAGWVQDAVISADGHHVAFTVNGSLAVADASQQAIYERNLVTGATILVSRADGAAGAQAVGRSDAPAISADGNRVAFESTANNLGDGDVDSGEDVHVRDLATGATLLVNRAVGGGKSSGYAAAPAISADGAKVAFVTTGDDLGDGDTDTVPDVHLRDLSAGTNTLVSATPKGAKGNASSGQPSISADGNRVAFASSASNLVPAGAPLSGIYVRDLSGGTMILADRADGASGAPSTGYDQYAAISPDGDAVAFVSRALSGGGSDVAQAYVRSLSRNTTTLISRGDGAAGAPATSDSFGVALSAGGRCALSNTSAALLGGVTSTDIAHVYVRAVGGTCGPAAGTADTPAPGPGPAARDRIAPVVHGATLRYKRFAVAKRRAASAARAAHRGTTLRLSLSEPARLTITVDRRVPGRRTRRGCTAVAHAPKRKACIAFKRDGTLSRSGLNAGLSQLAFSGRIGAHALAVGTHRMTIIATDAAGNRSKPTVLMFSITR